MNKRFAVLDSFRGICALSVVIYHMHLLDTITEWVFFRGSYLFVEFFFVLSGFVLTHGYLFKQDLKWKPFIISRFFRIYPLYICMLLFVLLFQIVKLIAYKYNVNFEAVPFTGPYDLTELLPNMLLLQSWTYFTMSTSFNAPSWSISIEFYMYFILFFLIISFKRSFFWVSLIISLLMMMSLIFNDLLVIPNVARGLSGFFGGVFIYHFYLKIKHLKFGLLLSTVIEMFFVFTVVLVVSTDFDHRGVVASILFMLTVLTFSFETGYLSIILKTRYFRLLGTLSFSIYLTHCVLINYLGAILKVIGKFTGNQFYLVVDGINFIELGSPIYNNLYVATICILTLIISTFTYKYIELRGLGIGKSIIQNYQGKK